MHLLEAVKNIMENLELIFANIVYYNALRNANN